jgi:predicted nucleotidyltransferase
MAEKILFKTLVGSHMWGMNTPQSDRDIMVVFQQDTKEILSGYGIQTGKVHNMVVENGVECDYQYMEIGHLVNLLLKGNINAFWTVTSPCVVESSPVLDDLRILANNNLSKMLNPSINGMAISQMNDEYKRPSMEGKGFRTALRTLNQGIAIFETGKIEFNSVGQHIAEDDVKTAFKELNSAYAHTKLPEKPDENLFRSFLYNVRVAGM